MKVSTLIFVIAAIITTMGLYGVFKLSFSMSYFSSGNDARMRHSHDSFFDLTKLSPEDMIDLGEIFVNLHELKEENLLVDDLKLGGQLGQDKSQIYAERRRRLDDRGLRVSSRWAEEENDMQREFDQFFYEQLAKSHREMHKKRAPRQRGPRPPPTVTNTEEADQAEITVESSLLKTSAIKSIIDTGTDVSDQTEITVESVSPLTIDANSITDTGADVTDQAAITVESNSHLTINVNSTGTEVGDQAVITIESSSPLTINVNSTTDAGSVASTPVISNRNTPPKCEDPNSQFVPCPPADLGAKCDKYNPVGDFRQCYTLCKASFCCIHDSKSQTYSPSCSSDLNCQDYHACYIIWWKLHDTIGPANFLRVVQDERFYQNVTFQFVLTELSSENDTYLFQQLFGHHFDGDDAPSDDKLQDPQYW